MKFGKNFILIFLPFHLLGLIGLFYLNQYLIYFLVIWFFIGIIGNGVAGHRYFAHGQFKTSIPIKWILGFLSTLGAIGPIHYWIIQHKTHHIKADKDGDPHDPSKGFFYAFYTWTFPQGANEKEYMKERFAKRLAINMSKDNFYLFFQKNHYIIIYIFCLLLLLVDPILLTLYALAYCVDFLRLGLVNYFCHGYGYRNHNTNDKSTNNFIIGMLTFGFGWHNNHHANPGKLILTERWWEIDIEGYVGYLLSKL